MTTTVPLSNYTDVEGAPICPPCGRPILPMHAVMRVDDCMIHVKCFQLASATEEPCEPAP